MKGFENLFFEAKRTLEQSSPFIFLCEENLSHWAKKTLNYTYYILDAQGNTMAVYERAVNASNQSVTFEHTEKHLFGSSRLGVMNVKVPMLGSQNTSYSMINKKHRIGERNYELSNHLGNVLSVVSDKPVPHTTNGTAHDYYMADIMQSTDYSGFGVQLSGRNFLKTGISKDYRRGFQGQEEDDELKGEGNSLNYTYRMHDPRLGRFFAIDPLAHKFPYYSPYQFCSNSPILAVELEGLESSVQLNFTETSVTISRNKNNQFVITTSQLNQIPSENKAMANGSWGIRDLRPGGQWELYCPDCKGPYGNGAYVRIILPKLEVTRSETIIETSTVTIEGTPEKTDKKNDNFSKEFLSFPTFDPSIFMPYPTVANNTPTRVANEIIAEFRKEINKVGVPSNDNVTAKLTSITIQFREKSQHDQGLIDLYSKLGVPVNVNYDSKNLQKTSAGLVQFNYTVTTVTPATPDTSVEVQTSKVVETTVNPLIITP